MKILFLLMMAITSIYLSGGSKNNFGKVSALLIAAAVMKVDSHGENKLSNFIF